MATQVTTPQKDTGWKIGAMTPAIREILGLMMWETGPIAHHLNKRHGHSIPPKGELEQADVMAFLLPFAIEFGDDWRRKAAEVLFPDSGPDAAAATAALQAAR